MPSTHRIEVPNGELATVNEGDVVELQIGAAQEGWGQQHTVVKIEPPTTPHGPAVWTLVLGTAGTATPAADPGSE